MKKILKIYGIHSPNDYYDICIESFINGQKTQAKEQYLAMNRDNRKIMLSYLLSDYESNKVVYHFFFNLL